MKQGLCITLILATIFLFSGNIFAKDINKLKRGDSLQLVEQPHMGWYWFSSVNIRTGPRLSGEKIIGNIFFSGWKILDSHYWTKDDTTKSDKLRKVTYLGLSHNGWLKIYYPEHQITGWVYGEFFGISEPDKFKKLSTPITVSVVVEKALLRKSPSFFGIPVIKHGRKGYGGALFGGFTVRKGKKLKIEGKKGNWLKVKDKDLWIFVELVR